MMIRSKVSLFAGLLLPLFHAAAEGPPPVPPAGPGPKPNPPGSHRPGGDRGDWRGLMPGGYGRPPMRSDGFDKLPEEERKRVRAALDIVWSRPEVIEARDKAMKANEEMRDIIRQSLEKTDPAAAAILAKIEPKDHFDPRQIPPLPATDSTEFPIAMVKRLGMEMLAFARPDRREETKKFHDRIMTQPAVQEALRLVETTRGEERIQSVQKLRTSYREAAMKEFQTLREKRGKEEPKSK